MTLTLQNTDRFVIVDGVLTRIWEGQNENGIKVVAFITRLAVNEENDNAQFEKELQICSAPTLDIPLFPLSMIV